MPIPSELQKNLNGNDKRKERKRKYVAKKETKARRVKVQNQNMKEEIAKQKRDAERGFTYQSGIALKGLVPVEVQKVDNEKKRINNIKCDMFGCHNPNHKTIRNKKCKYHTFNKRSLLRKEVDKTMRGMYSSLYGK